MAGSNPVRGSQAHRSLRAAVVAAYSLCCICGKPVDKTLSGRHSRGPSMQHHQMLMRGGAPLSWENVGLAHNGCNAGDGNRRRRTPRTGQSRDW